MGNKEVNNKSIEIPAGQEFNKIIDVSFKNNKEIYINYLENVIKIQINTINKL